MTLIDQIREMIAEGETEKSLNELYNYVNAKFGAWLTSRYDG